MEWDKIWAINKKHIDPIARKLTAISVPGKIIVNVANYDEIDQIEVMADYHPKNKSLGERLVYKAKEVILEKEDL